MPNNTGTPVGIQKRVDSIGLRAERAARYLGLSLEVLRRYGVAYERVFGDLPGDRRGRVYPSEALETIERAVRAFHQGLSPSVEAALEALSQGEDLYLRTPPEERELLENTLIGLRKLEERLTALETDIVAIKRRVEAFGETGLEPVLHGIRVVHEELMSLGQYKDEEVESLKRRLNYLQSELERRKENSERQPVRLWWRRG
ncbi:MAG: hypothetical protein JSV66_17155 [Trueperaceae bacterium]|nr:MAG: hypothetical protein JSV66_17155 [Trueperaceae bacterium]